jgi:hypothetical protein
MEHACCKQQEDRVLQTPRGVVGIGRAPKECRKAPERSARSRRHEGVLAYSPRDGCE